MKQLLRAEPSVLVENPSFVVHTLYMRKIMVFQHVGHEPLGTLDPLLKTAGFRIRYVNFGRHPDVRPSLDGYGGLIVLGGPMGVYEDAKYPHLKFEMKAIEDALKRELPVLGICLGSQLLASVLGAGVRKAERGEIGWHRIDLTAEAAEDRLFTGCAPSEMIFQLHQDTFDLPEGVIHLARSELFKGQAFRHGTKAYGFQFHLEADQPMISRWMKRPENRLAMDRSEGGQSIQKIEDDTARFMARSLELSQQTFGRFIEMLGPPERNILLGSGHGKPPRGGH